MGIHRDSEGSPRVRQADLVSFFTLAGISVGLVFGFRSYRDFEKSVEDERYDRVEADGKLLTKIAELQSRIVDVEKWKESSSVDNAKYVERFSICCNGRKGER